MLEHLKYELQKHYDYRIKGLSLDEVRKFDGEVTPLLQKAVDSTADADKLAADVAPHLPFVDAENTDSIDATAIIAKGKRADHDQLPDDIKEIWDANIQRWKRIKELFEACKAYQLSCDRFEGLNAANEEFQKMLLTLKTEYYAYKQSMDQYDHAVPGQKEENAETKTDVVISANAIGNARSYITKNIDKLIQLKADGKTEQAEKLQANIEQRVKTLLDAKAEIKPATLDKIKEAGIVIPAEGEDGSIAEEKPDESQADQTGTETAPAE